MTFIKVIVQADYFADVNMRVIWLYYGKDARLIMEIILKVFLLYTGMNAIKKQHDGILLCHGHLKSITENHVFFHDLLFVLTASNAQRQH